MARDDVSSVGNGSSNEENGSMVVTRLVGLLSIAALAACDPETKIEYVQVPGPPGPGDVPEAPPPEQITDLALNVDASQVTGAITLKGGAFPIDQFERGKIRLYGAHAQDFFDLAGTNAQSYGVLVVNGTYDFRYLFEKGGVVVPTNGFAEIIGDRAIGSDGAIPVDVGAVVVTPTFTLNGGAFPASNYDGAKFYLKPVGGTERILLGESQLANGPVRVVPGSYDVIYDYKFGDVSPISKGARVMANVALSQDGPLAVDVVSSSLRLTFKHNGNAFPLSQYDDANFYLRDKVSGEESWLMNSHAPVSSVNAIDATYDVIYRHETGDQVPINRAAVIVENFVLAAGGALAHDIVSVTINANVTLNGAAFPVSQYDDGNILLHVSKTNTDTELGNTHSPFTALVLIPGTYDVLYSHETGDDVPQNVRGKVAEGVVVSNAPLNVNVVGVQIDTNVTLNGAAFPASQYDDAKIKLSYLTTGQSVPDDIEPGAAQRVAQLILHGQVRKSQNGGKP
jgi:hypothetical protein